MPSEQRDWQRRDLPIGERVHAALRQRRLLFAFQPVVCAATGEVDYFECLLRVRDDAGAIIGGGDLVASAERRGWINLIDRYVLEMAVQELTGHPEVRLGLNVSGLTAGDRTWLRRLIGLLHGRPGLAQRLIVEITETAALDDLDESARFVDTLRETGCRVALDDFGAGYTSLRHLQRLSVDTIKIDGSLVCNLSASPDRRVFLRHVLGLARNFGFRTVAECVESAEDAALLRAEGIGYLQGYHFGLPTIERAWLADPPASRRLDSASWNSPAASPVG